MSPNELLFSQTAIAELKCWDDESIPLLMYQNCEYRFVYALEKGLYLKKYLS